VFEDFTRTRPIIIDWIEPPFEPEIDLNFIGLNAKVIIKFKEDKIES
jgi:hypothetical protein